jgi:hypothetical protein
MVALGLLKGCLPRVSSAGAVLESELLHNLVEASIDLFRYQYMRDKL